MKEIQLTKNKIAWVDDADYEIVNQYRWYALYAKGPWYAYRADYSTGKKRSISLHRMLLNPPAGTYVDHIDRNGLNCQRRNLRICSQSENMRNQKVIRGRSRYKGVSYSARYNKWRATIHTKQQQIHLGYYETELEAAKMYDTAARWLFRQFARPNFGSAGTIFHARPEDPVLEVSHTAESPKESHVPTIVEVETHPLLV